MNIHRVLCAFSFFILIYTPLTHATPVQESESLRDYAKNQFHQQTEQAKARLGQELVQRIVAGAITYEGVASYINDHEVDPNFCDSSSRSLLTYAIIKQRKDLVCCLLRHGASVTLSGAKNETPLHWAVRIKSLDILRILLRQHTPINQKDTSEQTALMYAAKAGYARIARYLLEHGALKTLRDADDKTAQMHAEEQSHERLARLLAPHTPLPRSVSQRLLSLSPRTSTHAKK